MSNTYWSGNGKFQAAADAVQQLIPAGGAVANPRTNAALEKFRKASNCYYDLYNNGLYNRAAEFYRVFGISSRMFKVGFGEYTHDMYRLVEVRMDEIVQAAATEQNIAVDTATA